MVGGKSLEDRCAPEPDNPNNQRTNMLPSHISKEDLYRLLDSFDLYRPLHPNPIIKRFLNELATKTTTEYVKIECQDFSVEGIQEWLNKAKENQNKPQFYISCGYEELLFSYEEERPLCEHEIHHMQEWLDENPELPDDTIRFRVLKPLGSYNSGYVPYEYDIITTTKEEIEARIKELE